MYPRSMKLPLILSLTHLICLSSHLKAEANSLAPANIIARRGCKDKCGDVSIPFPWGIGTGCFLDSWFEVDCNSSSNKPFLSKLNIELLEIDPLDHQRDHTVKARIPVLNVCTSDAQTHTLSSIDLRGSPYNFSASNNSYIMEGCAGSTALFDQSHNLVSGCATVCFNNDTTVSTKQCYGVECCQFTLYPYTTTSTDLSRSSGVWGFYPYTTTLDPYNSPYYSPFQFYQIDFLGQTSSNARNCLAATFIDSNHVSDYIGNISTSEASIVPVVLLWSWISHIRPDQNDSKVQCYNYSLSKSIYCNCVGNSYGINPYVTNGCQVPKECEGCRGYCSQTDGYTCHHSNNRWSFLTNYIAVSIYIALSVAIAPLLLVFGCRWLYRFTKSRRKAERKVKFFKQMLQRHQSSNHANGVVESTKLFSHKELDKATEHFNDNRVLGKGGQGTVYKGMLTDGRIVAVKRSKQIDETQMEQFINEVVILSQTNHRNVVKLLGCCLETEVPLLAYEYISNGTLHQHIHNPSEDVFLGWATRLKIAADSAGAIAYLHSSSSTPIYHRDIKSANILLDEEYRAKVSDFGISKTIEIDQTHLTTLVQGTFGYLDPEYFESSVFTEKSDVYSFGVVMLELLTSKKPIFRNKEMEQKSLVPEFYSQMQNHSLSNILDPEVVKEAKEEEILVYADLARQCLNESGRLRPTMKEVAMALEMIIKPPAEMHAQSSRSFQYKAFDELVTFEMSNMEMKSSSARTDAPSSMCIDVEPLLHNTI